MLEALRCPQAIDGEAGGAAGQGGLPERQDSAPGVPAATASRPAEDDHREGGRDLHRSQTGPQQGEWRLDTALHVIVYCSSNNVTSLLDFLQSQYDTPLLELIGIENEIDQ